MNYNFNYCDNKLSQQLSNTEFTYYYDLMKQGNKEAYNILFNSNLRLVIYKAKQFVNNTINNTSFNTDDLINSGTIGLMKALDSFVFEENVTFATYASRCIENEILMVLKKNKKYDFDISLYTMVDDKRTIEETVSYEYDLEEEVIKNIFHKKIRSFILTLPDFERTVAVLYYGFGCERLSQKKIADKLEVPTWKVIETIEQIVKKGKRYLNREHFNVLKKKYIENSALKQEQKYREEIDNISKNKIRPKGTFRKNNAIFISLFELFPNYDQKDVLDAVKRLNKINRKIIEMRYGLSGNQPSEAEEIAIEFEITIQSVYAHIINSRKKMHQYLETINQQNNCITSPTSSLLKNTNLNSHQSIKQLEKMKLLITFLKNISDNPTSKAILNNIQKEFGLSIKLDEIKFDEIIAKILSELDSLYNNTYISENNIDHIKSL